MKKVVSIICLLVAMGAFGGSSGSKWMDWLETRSDDSDALRLRAAYAECVKKVESPAENVSIPIESFTEGKAKGKVKSRIKAARAQIFVDSSFVWGEKIRVEQFNEDGTLHASLDAENCVIDRKSKSGWVEGNAQMVYGDSSVRGRGVYFSLEREFVKIFSQSEIRTGRSRIGPGSLLK